VAEQRQTVVSQFFQVDRLVVEGGKAVRAVHVVIVQDDWGAVFGAKADIPHRENREAKEMT